MRETWVRFLGQEDSLEKEMATHSSILAWRILWTEEPGGLQSIGSQRVGHDWGTSLHVTSVSACREVSVPEAVLGMLNKPLVNKANRNISVGCRLQQPCVWSRSAGLLRSSASCSVSFLPYGIWFYISHQERDILERSHEKWKQESVKLEEVQVQKASQVLSSHLNRYE